MFYDRASSGSGIGNAMAALIDIKNQLSLNKKGCYLKSFGIVGAHIKEFKRKNEKKTQKYVYI